MPMKKKKVFVGMSGGVDSSVTAALLKEQGYDVTGVFMKNWSRDLPGFKCPWAEDLADAKRVAVQLGIPFEVFDFEKEYFDKVVGYMLDGFRSGITPNPDIMCNQEIKFKLFLDTALQNGADMIATGHYARVADTGVRSKQLGASDENSTESAGKKESSDASLLNTNSSELLKAKDQSKDQTYFLYRSTSQALSKTIFPLGNMLKSEVREKAEELGLVTAKKKDSVGICFVGEVGIKEFLKNFVDYNSGLIVDQNGKEVGEHDGAIFYTIGQRHGLGVGGGLPYYVTGKDMDQNIVYVTSDIDDKKLWSSSIKIASPHWINQSPVEGEQYDVVIRYQSKPIKATYKDSGFSFEETVKAVTPGQSAVVYSGEECLGGGIII